MLENLSSDKRKNLSFHVLSILREALNIAKKSGTPTTYEQAFDTLFDLDPDLYKEVINELPQKNINETAKLYVTRARLTNAENPEIDAIAAIDEEFNANEMLLQSSTNSEEDKRPLTNRQFTLLAAKKSLQERRIREHRILQRDFSKIDRTDFGAQFIEEDDFKVDYVLGRNSYLRLRLLHPEVMEAITGADLIYEQQDVSSRKVRAMFLQYKIWDDDGVMYFSQGSLEAQLRKMKSAFCEKGFCNQPSSLNGQLDYRFPYCSCFLRPTDAMQETDTRLISSGIHIPVCSALKLRDEGEVRIDKKEMRAQTLTHNIFEPLFNKGFVGSRWLTENELKEFYLDNKIMETNESLLVYAREIIEDDNSAPF